MNEHISFFVPGIPKGQPRPRAFSINGVARVFDAGTAEAWKSKIALYFADSPPRGQVLFDGPVALSLAFRFPRPKNHYRTGKMAGSLKDGAPLAHTSRPDLDNLAKAVLDALTELRAWRDDAQVAQLIQSKTYDANPGCLIELAPIGNTIPIPTQNVFDL